MPHLSVNRIDVYYERFGEGTPVLNISGSNGDLRKTAPSKSPLNKHFDVVHYDQRGLGQTSKPDATYSMADYAKDAKAVIQHFGWSKAHVVGTSFGGMVGLNLAINHPDVVDKLVLLCTSPGGTKASFPIELLEEMDVEAALELRLGLLDNRWDPGADDPIPGLGPVYDWIIADARKTPDPEAKAGFARQLQARKGHNVQALLHRVEAQTLVCAGEYDDQAPVANSVALVEGIPDAQLRVFQGGHLFTLQDKTAYPAIIDFLGEQ